MYGKTILVMNNRRTAKDETLLIILQHYIFTSTAESLKLFPIFFTSGASSQVTANFACQ
jgi:hypothetical protein